MAFITRSLKNGAVEALSRCLLALWIAWLWLPGTSLAALTEITQLRAERAGDGVYLSAVVRFEVPPPVEDALLKGIAIFFVVEVDLYRDRWYWTNPRVASAARTLRLAYQPLTGRWRVNIVSGLIASSSGLRATLNQNYDTMAEALAAVQRLTRWKIAESAELDTDASYLLDLSFRLDLSQLPRPFQIGVAGQRDWAIFVQVRDRLRLAPETPASEGPR